MIGKRHAHHRDRAAHDDSLSPVMFVALVLYERADCRAGDRMSAQHVAGGRADESASELAVMRRIDGVR